MHSAILVIKKPVDAFQKEHVWRQFLASLPEILKRDVKTEILSENCFLIPLQSGLPGLALLIRECLEYGYPYKVTFFEKELQWF